MYNTIPEQFTTMHRQSLEAMQEMAMASLAGWEKLAELNLQATKASIKEGVEQGVTYLETRDPKALGETLAEQAQPTSDKINAYAKHVAEIANQTGTELSRIVEKQMNEANRQMFTAVDAMAKNAPAGSEGLMTMMKSAMTAANSTWDQVNKASKQVVELTEANVANATRQATKAAKKVA